MYLPLIRKLALTAGTLLAIAACGGGGDGYSTAGGGTGGTGVSYGSIAAFGSIVVNNVHFDVASSIVTEDGVQDDGTDLHRGLKLGMVVEVGGTFDSDTTGTAMTVTYRNNLVGPVTTMSSSPINVGQQSTIVAAGQTVVIDANTVVATASTPADGNLNQLPNTTNTTLPLALGNVIEVSGLRDVTRQIHATRVEVRSIDLASFTSAGHEIEVKGTIASVGPAANTFQIGELIVNYGSANTQDLPGATPAVGQFVEVKGTIFDAMSNTLTATEVEPVEDEGFGATTSANKAEVEGFVTTVTPTVTPPDQFTVGNQLVQTTVYTVFENGRPDDIAVGIKVEVDGSLAGGTLTATKVSFK